MSVSLAGNEIPTPKALVSDESMDFFGDMETFLEVFQTGKPEIVEGARGRVEFLLGHAARVQAEAEFFDKPEFPLTPDGIQKMGEVRGAIGEEFISALAGYYQRLERRVSTLIHELQLQGVNYLVDNEGKYYDQAVAEIEGILNEMRRGYEVVSKQALAQISPAYRQIDLRNGLREDIDIPGRLTADAVEFDSENLELDQIFEMLENGGSVEELTHRMIKLAKSMITHMSDDLAGQTGILFAEFKGSERYKRNLECLNEDALQQLEYILDVVVRIIRVINNTRIQKNLLLGT
ncbi:hypothetical protein KJ742_07760 [Patescibacteria group bacterium]|nr:hypothetical protein [Patescibacteria group bacterium]MBU1683807.1 hypothetical protein [Patescibacteria group bacterium]MBU1935072.1 hypothetical protein [Patescibacteria group bacterium]